MDLALLEQELVNAQERFRAACEAMASKHQGDEWEEYRLADAALLEAERDLAGAKAEEHAVPSDFPVSWDVGAPCPVLVTNDHSVFLMFFVRRFDPKWDGTYVTVQDPSNANAQPMALVEFQRCVSTKFGDPNDEVLEGHPLYGKGLDSYTAQIVRNSKWLVELESINKVHSMYNPDRWRNLNHFVFWFHDNTFECVAEKYDVEVYNETLKEILVRVYDRMR